MTPADPTKSSVQKQIPIIGLLGGVASGKSAVAVCFERLGCAVLDGDALGHRVLTDPEVVAAAKLRWGPSVLHDGQPNRREIASRVFVTQTGSQSDLSFWESVTHPRIGELLRKEIAQLRENGQYDGIVLDAAVMLKAGWQKECDFLVFVDAPWEVRLDRALSRGWTASQLRQREAAQTSVEEKRRLADFVIDNSADLEQTYEQVVKVWHALSR